MALLALVAAIALSPREHVFDENYYIKYVALLHRSEEHTSELQSH